MKTVSVNTARRVQLIDVTGEVKSAVSDSGVESGLCVVYVPHTTAGVTINEGADPSVARDIEMHLTKLVPERGGFAHAEGNSDSHIKTLITGPSVTIPVEGGGLVLGTWQSVFFCEYDGPRARKMHIKVV